MHGANMKNSSAIFRESIHQYTKFTQLQYVHYSTHTYYIIVTSANEFGSFFSTQASLPNFNTAKAALKFGSEAWVLKKREEKLLEAAQMKFLRHLLGITKLDKE